MPCWVYRTHQGLCQILAVFETFSVSIETVPSWSRQNWQSSPEMCSWISNLSLCVLCSTAIAESSGQTPFLEAHKECMHVFLWMIVSPIQTIKYILSALHRPSGCEDLHYADCPTQCLLDMTQDCDIYWMPLKFQNVILWHHYLYEYWFWQMYFFSC